MKITNIDVYGFEPAIRGMRNSFASWDKSDSRFGIFRDNEDEFGAKIGPADLDLMQKLYKAGGSERKFMRMIQVWCDISAPLTWWKQFDTYKVGTTGNSTSTMHSITTKKFKWDDFDVDYHDPQLASTIDYLNASREEYLYTEDISGDERKLIWRRIIDNLPGCYIQLRTVNLNYEVIAHMINDREHHKLEEWHIFCDYMLENLPYLRDIMGK